MVGGGWGRGEFYSCPIADFVPVLVGGGEVREGWREGEREGERVCEPHFAADTGGKSSTTSMV